MPVSRHKVGLLIAFVAPALIASVQLAAGKKKDKNSLIPQIEEQKRAVHALNRLTFGPRPGDVQRIIAIGVDQWMEQQLHPEKIDDHALEARLAPFRTLRMDAREMMQNYPSPEMVKAVMNGKQPLPPDPIKRAIYEDEIERMQQKQERKREALANAAEKNGNTTADSPATISGGNAKLTDSEMAQRREGRLYADLKAQELLSLSPDQRMKEILRMSPDQRRMLAAVLKGPKGEEFMEGMSPQQKETLMALNNPQQLVVNELTQAKLLRAIYSERQLDEVMTDFWFNHFNVFIGKGPDRYLITSYERDVIRAHALGKFEDLLVATVRSSAMLVYLDNFLSVGPNSDVALGIPKNPRRPRRRGFGGGFPRRPPAQNAQARRSGLNENYGRELMELHTLGVNGGYTQKDVTEVARVFTGWTVEKPQEGGGFKFDSRMHEPGNKMVLGHKIKNSGEKEGREVLHLLAHHPSTAKFISTKLAMRFVSDNPPPALVGRMAQIFLKKDADIREVLRTMFRSPEFWAPDTYRAKVKTPLEFVVSSLRATGAEVTDAQPLIRELNQLGMPLYAMQPPTGYSMKAESWVNSWALLNRMNFALALGADKLKGVQPNEAALFAPQAPSTDSHQALAVLENALLAGDVSPQTHNIISQQLDQPTPDRRPADPPSANISTITGLILGSPEFQRR